MSVTLAPPRPETFADLHRRLGCVPLDRIWLDPPIGTATEADVLRRPNGEKHLFELVDGVLVEKAMGFYESLVAAVLIGLFRIYLRQQNDAGVVLGADGMMRMAPGLVRIPDVSFISWEKFPNRELPSEPVPHLAPDLAVEVISRGNTEAEMERKLKEYFSVGVRLVWYIYPDQETAHVYTSPVDPQVLQLEDALDGGNVLPGFRATLRELFEQAGHRRGRP